jgi:hypothetical protein
MSKLRDYLKDHPILTILTALASLVTIIGFFSILKTEYAPSKNNEPGSVKYQEAKEYDSSDASILSFLEYRLNNLEAKTLEPYMGTSGAFSVYKKKILVFNIPLSELNRYDLEEEKFLNELSLRNIIKIKVLSDAVNKNLHIKELETSLTDTGKKYFIGETIDYYYLKTFDIADIQLVSKEIHGDTIAVEFKIGKFSNKSPLFDLIQEEEKEKMMTDLNKTMKIKLRLRAGTLKIIYE